MKKLLSLILAFSIILSLCPLSSLADTLTLPDPMLIPDWSKHVVFDRQEEYDGFRASVYTAYSDKASIFAMQYF